MNKNILIGSVAGLLIVGCNETNENTSKIKNPNLEYAIDGFSLVKNSDKSTIDLTRFIKNDNFILSSISSKEGSCEILSSNERTFDVRVADGVLCEYDYTIKSNNLESNAVIRVLSSSESAPILSPILINAEKSSKSTINLNDYLIPAGYKLLPLSVSLPEYSSNSVSVDGNEITFNNHLNVSWEKIVYVLSNDSKTNANLVGEIYITNSDGSNSPPNISNLNYDYIRPLSDCSDSDMASGKCLQMVRGKTHKNLVFTNPPAEGFFKPLNLEYYPEYTITDNGTRGPKDGKFVRMNLIHSQAYCNKLSELEYNGYTQWRMPYFDEIRPFINNDYKSNNKGLFGSLGWSVSDDYMTNTLEDPTNYYRINPHSGNYSAYSAIKSANYGICVAPTESSYAVSTGDWLEIDLTSLPDLVIEDPENDEWGITYADSFNATVELDNKESSTSKIIRFKSGSVGKHLINYILSDSNGATSSGIIKVNVSAKINAVSWSDVELVKLDSGNNDSNYYRYTAPLTYSQAIGLGLDVEAIWDSKQNTIAGHSLKSAQKSCSVGGRLPNINEFDYLRKNAEEKMLNLWPTDKYYLVQDDTFIRAVDLSTGNEVLYDPEKYYYSTCLISNDSLFLDMSKTQVVANNIPQYVATIRGLPSDVTLNFDIIDSVRLTSGDVDFATETNENGIISVSVSSAKSGSFKFVVKVSNGQTVESLNIDAIADKKTSTAKFIQMADILANGITPTTVTIETKDANGNPIANVKITPKSDRVEDTFFPNSVESDSSGLAVFNVFSTKVGSPKFTVSGVSKSLPVTAKVRTRKYNDMDMYDYPNNDGPWIDLRTVIETVPNDYDSSGTLTNTFYRSTLVKQVSIEHVYFGTYHRFFPRYKMDFSTYYDFCAYDVNIIKTDKLFVVDSTHFSSNCPLDNKLEGYQRRATQISLINNRGVSLNKTRSLLYF
ncbi:hypothetical protein GNP48_19345 [Aliivibrio fischeri]|nr:Ig-like domain-containing protein [Aliivibrio fischeri]MUK28468.1 hypothetical protein [Aliivibrio fischeri]